MAVSRPSTSLGIAVRERPVTRPITWKMNSTSPVMVTIITMGLSTSKGATASNTELNGSRPIAESRVTPNVVATAMRFAEANTACPTVGDVPGTDDGVFGDGVLSDHARSVGHNSPATMANTPTHVNKRLPEATAKPPTANTHAAE